MKNVCGCGDSSLDERCKVKSSFKIFIVLYILYVLHLNRCCNPLWIYNRILSFMLVHLFVSVKDSLLSLFSDTESESLASSNDDGDSQRRSPSPQPVIPASETGLLAPLYEGSPMGIILPGLSGNKKTDLTQGELQDRFKKMISAAVDFVLYTGIQCCFFIIRV